MGTKTELRKALTTTATALLPYDLDPVLHEELLKLQPMLELMQVIPAKAKTHEYTVRTSHPLGWFEGEVTPANARTGSYSRKSVALKILRNWGSVSGFARAADAAFVDALAIEIEASLEGLANVIEYGALYGTANDIGFTGDAYQFSGMLPRVYAYAASNVINAGGDKITLDDLDAALAAISGFRGIRADPKFFIMGQRMKQVVDGLQTKVQLPLQSVELAEGRIVMAAYGNAPIMESDFVVPASTSTSPAVTAVPAAGGSLADADHWYRISSVTAYGEQVAGTAEESITSSTNNTSNLTWTHDDNALLYMIWRRDGDTGTWYLLDIIPALTYDSAGTVNGVVEAYSDDGSRTLINVQPLETGEQIIVLANTNPNRGVAMLGMIDDMGNQVDSLVSFIELARTKDTFDFMLKSYEALRLVHPNLVAVIRNAKLA